MTSLVLFTFVFGIVALMLVGPLAAVWAGEQLANNSENIRAWLIRQSEVYPARWWWPVLRIYGGPDGQQSRTCYMTRIFLTLYQHRRMRQLYLHIFHREDMDRDPHDHPFGFWTFPINQGYYEEVFDHTPEGEGCWKTLHVPRLRWSYRPAEHTHRVVGTDNGTWPLVTLVMREKNARKWGFWCHFADPIDEREKAARYFVPFQKYIYEGFDANNPGIEESCPGTSGRLTDGRKPG